MNKSNGIITITDSIVEIETKNQKLLETRQKIIDLQAQIEHQKSLVRRPHLGGGPNASETSLFTSKFVHRRKSQSASGLGEEEKELERMERSKNAYEDFIHTLENDIRQLRSGLNVDISIIVKYLDISSIRILFLNFSDNEYRSLFSTLEKFIPEGQLKNRIEKHEYKLSQLILEEGPLDWKLETHRNFVNNVGNEISFHENNISNSDDKEESLLRLRECRNELMKERTTLRVLLVRKEELQRKINTESLLTNIFQNKLSKDFKKLAIYGGSNVVDTKHLMGMLFNEFGEEMLSILVNEKGKECLPRAYDQVSERITQSRERRLNLQNEIESHEKKINELQEEFLKYQSHGSSFTKMIKNSAYKSNIKKKMSFERRTIDNCTAAKYKIEDTLKLEESFLHLLHGKMQNKSSELVSQSVVDQIIGATTIINTGTAESTESTNEAQTETNSSGLACAICLDNMINSDVNNGTLSLPCSHTFHRTCVGTWLETKKICPLCKIEVIWT